MTELMTATERNATETEKVRRVCFVCTGNTCRSPMAEAVANALAEQYRLAFPEAVRDSIPPLWEAVSAGLYPNVGEPINPKAVKVLQAANIEPTAARDYRLHTATPLSEDLVRSCDLLVGMSKSHTLELMMRYPEAVQRIVCMPQEIADPYGGSLADYTACLCEITEGVNRLLFEAEGRP